MLEIKEDVIYVNSTSKLAYKKFMFLRDLIQNLIDSYYIVLTTINEIMEKGYRIQKNHILPDLHQGIQEIYYQGAVKYMNSCLLETLHNAFETYSQLGVCDLKSYEPSDGPNIVFIECPIARKPLLEEYFNILEAMSTCSSNP